MNLQYARTLAGCRQLGLWAIDQIWPNSAEQH